MARAGETEKDLLYLEDTVSLLEKVMMITAETELCSSSPWLKDITYIAEEDYSASGNLLLASEEERIIYIHNGKIGCYCIIPSWYYRILTVTEDTEWYSRECHYLDTIRNDPRYIDLTERVKALVQTRKKAE